MFQRSNMPPQATKGMSSPSPPVYRLREQDLKVIICRTLAWGGQCLGLALLTGIGHMAWNAHLLLLPSSLYSFKAGTTKK